MPRRIAVELTVANFIDGLKKLKPDYKLSPEMTVNFLMIFVTSVNIPKKEIHIRRHQELHRSLDELVADMMYHTGHLPSKTSLMQLMEWSNSQTENPTETT